MGTRGKRTKPIPESFIQVTPTVTCRVDICGRISKCRLCSNPIRSGEKRFGIFTTVPARQRRNGGIVTKLEKFYHPACFMKYIGVYSGENVPETYAHHEFQQREERCIDCGVGFAGGHPVARARLSSSFPWEPLCAGCSNSDKWHQCSWCGSYVKKYSISKYAPEATLGTGPATQYDICDSCAENENVKTDKRIRAAIRRQVKQQKAFENYKRELEERYARED